MKISMQKCGMVIMLGAGLVLGTSAAQASLKDMKVYKEAYPEAKPKCVDCHAQAMPKKDDGQHELSDYAKAASAIANPPTAEAYTKVGPIENFKAK